MGLNQFTEAVPPSLLRPLPFTDKGIAAQMASFSEELRVVLTEAIEMLPQVADVEPSPAKKGWIRFAVSPWDPLSTATWPQKVWYDGSAWAAL